MTTHFFFCFVAVGATLIEARTSFGVTGMLTEFTLEDGESNGIPRVLLAGRPFKLFDGVCKLLMVPPVVRELKEENHYLFYLRTVPTNKAVFLFGL